MFEQTFRNIDDRDFLFYLLLTDAFTEYAIRGSARAGIPKVNRDHLFAYRTRTPPLPEQRRIAAILDEAFEGIATAKAIAEKNLQNARELFRSHAKGVFLRGAEQWPVRTEAVWKLFALVDVIAPIRPTGVIDGAIRRRPGPNAERSLPRATR